jgi:lipopolysaccharide export system permease protein
MNRVDRIIVGRLVATIGLTVLILYGIMALAEALNVGRLQALAARGGIAFAALGVAVSASRVLLSGFSVVMLIGAIAGLLSLQSSRELTVIKASGLSVWRLMRAPLLLALALGLVLSLGLDTGIARIDRDVLAAPAPDEALWLESGSGEARYILEARDAAADGSSLTGVTIFMLDARRTRIEADRALLDGGRWRLDGVSLRQADAPARTEASYELTTTLSAAAVRTQLQAINKLTVFELGAALAAGVRDSTLRDSLLTRFLSKIALPLSLVGSLCIAFAFTGGYRKTNNYGGAVLYGVVLGFVVYVVTEMAFRAGDAGIVAPSIAACGPPFVAIVAGVTVLLFREDGRTT